MKLISEITSLSKSFSWRWLFFSFLTMLFLMQCSPKTASQQAQALSVREPDIRVCIAENPRESTLAFQGIYTAELEEARYIFDDGVGRMSVNLQDGRLILSNENRFFELLPPQVVIFKPQMPKDQFILNDIPYQGELTIHFLDGEVTLINTIAMEGYLKGVLPYEIPTAREDYKEAVMAQAIAARSYAHYRLENPVNDLYDTWADERDQVYKGTDKTTPLAERAISETHGIVLADETGPMITQFHSTCGGVLEEYIGSDPSGFAFDLTDNEYNCKVSPHYRWVEFREVETVLWNLSREFDIDSSQVNSWIEAGYELVTEVTGRKSSGRVSEILLNIQGAEYRVDDFRIRRVLADKSGKILKSNFFFFRTSPANPEKFYIIGAGAGHGSGMCQWGAIGMALKGYSHNNILGLYYPQLSIKKVY